MNGHNSLMIYIRCVMNIVCDFEGSLLKVLFLYEDGLSTGQVEVNELS